MSIYNMDMAYIMWIPYKCDINNLLLNAGTELWSSPSRHFSQPTHDPRWKADTRQVKVGPRHKTWRWDEHVSGIGELPVLFNSEWQGGRARCKSRRNSTICFHLPLTPRNKLKLKEILSPVFPC